MGLAVSSGGPSLCNERSQKPVHRNLHVHRCRHHDRLGAYGHPANESGPLAGGGCRRAMTSGLAQTRCQATARAPAIRKSVDYVTRLGCGYAEQIWKGRLSTKDHRVVGQFVWRLTLRRPIATGSRLNPEQQLMTLSTSAVAVCCCKDSRSSNDAVGCDVKWRLKRAQNGTLGRPAHGPGGIFWLPRPPTRWISASVLFQPKSPYKRAIPEGDW
jgi:hypothetical protein